MCERGLQQGHSTAQYWVGGAAMAAAAPAASCSEIFPSRSPASAASSAVGFPGPTPLTAAAAAAAADDGAAASPDGWAPSFQSVEGVTFAAAAAAGFGDTSQPEPPPGGFLHSCPFCIGGTSLVLPCIDFRASAATAAVICSPSVASVASHFSRYPRTF